MRIPTSVNLNRRIPNGATGVDTSNNDLGLGQVAGLVNNIHERRTSYSTSTAQADFFKAKLEQDNAYDQDEDYSTIEDRYTQGLKGSLEEAAMGISDRRARAEFVRTNQLRLEEGRQRIRKLAFGKERDSNRASIDERLESLKDFGVSGSIDAAYQTASDILNDAAGLGYYSEEEAGDVRKAFRDKLAVSRLEALPADEQLKELKLPWTKNIPASTRNRLINAAREDGRRSKAIDTVDGIFDRGLDEAQALKEIRKIGNDGLRLEVERRYENQLSRQKSARQERETELSQENFLAVRRGELSVDDIGRDTLEEMTPAQINALYAAEKEAAKGSKPETSRQAFAAFYEHMGKGEVFLARQYVLDNANLFDDGDYESLIRASSTKIADTFEEDQKPNPVKSVLSVQKELDLRLVQLKIGEENIESVKGEVLLAYDRWNKDFQNQNGKEPTGIERSERMNQLLREATYKPDAKALLAHDRWVKDYRSKTGKEPTRDERSKKLNQLMVDISYNPQGRWNEVKNKPSYDMTEEDYKAAMRAYQSTNPIKFNRILEEFAGNGVDPSLTEFVTRYNESD